MASQLKVSIDTRKMLEQIMRVIEDGIETMPAEEREQRLNPQYLAELIEFEQIETELADQIREHIAASLEITFVAGDSDETL